MTGPTSNHRQFLLPEKGEIFTDQVIERCKNLAAARIWEGLSPVALDTWLMNFSEPLERYFAACVLDALIFRSRKQTVALMEHLFQRAIPDLVRLQPPSEGPTEGWLEILSVYDQDPGIRLVPVLQIDAPPTKSGPLLARHYRRHLSIQEKWMIWPWKIGEARSSGAHSFIFVDDFLGTGRQFLKFSAQFNLQDQLKGAYGVYAPLVAHEKGLSKIQTQAPFVHLCSAETLDSTHCLFHPSSRYFSDGINSPAAARRYYHEILARKGFHLSRETRSGFGRLALAYSFEHATPNNCLPLLWMRTASWEPLFRR